MKFYEIKDSTGDERGANYLISDTVFDFLNTISDMYIAEILPNKNRGNHFHKEKKEVILVSYKDSWILKWSNCNDDNKKTFSGEGAIIIEINPYCVHSIENIGGSKLIILAMSDIKYQKESTDTFPGELLQNQTAQIN